MNNSKLLITAMLSALMVFSCAPKEESSTNDTVAAVPTPDGSPLLPGIPNGGGGSGGGNMTQGTVPFVPVSREMMENYIGSGIYSHPLNNPSNFRVSVSLKHAGDLRYAGEIRIAYEDIDANGNTYTTTGVFKAPEGKNESFPSHGYNQDVGLYKAHYNYWFNLNGQTAFTGIFQDQLGAIILVIDNAINLGDGQGGGTVSGSIWFKNFANSLATQSDLRNCWFIYMGPFQCHSQALKAKNSLVMAENGGTSPNDWRKLGTFSGMVKSQILN